MKSFARFAVVGVAGVALLKLFTTLFIPLLGMVLGLLALTIKVAVIAAIAYFLWSFFGKRPEAADKAEEREMEEKIEIVVEEVFDEEPGGDGTGSA